MFNFIRRWQKRRKEWQEQNDIADRYRRGRESAKKHFGIEHSKPRVISGDELKRLQNKMLCPQTIEDAIREYKMIIGTNWYNSYIRYATGEPNDIALLEDFQEDINRDFQPKLRRHLECKQIDHKQYQEFQGWILEALNKFKNEIDAIEPKEQEDPIIKLIKNLELSDTQKKAVAKYLKAEKGCNGDCKGCAGVLNG